MIVPYLEWFRYRVETELAILRSLLAVHDSEDRYGEICESIRKLSSYTTLSPLDTIALIQDWLRAGNSVDAVVAEVERIINRE